MMLRIKIFCNFERYIVMADFEIIKCHGSGNDFVMVDTTREKGFAGVDRSAFARAVSDRVSGIGSDGVLYIVRHDDGHYAMDMYNPDGTQAEMCGNGMRCVARLADERGYIVDGILRSGGRDYPVERAESIAEGIATYAVDIPIAVSSPDFAFFGSSERWLGKVIESFDKELKFSVLSLGNPHIVASVDRVDLEKLEALGEAVKQRRDLFPNGVNLSLYERRSEREIFVATYERGAGITLSCGTAMTASATAAALLGIVEAGERIEVKNRGGKVACRTTIGDSITTRLEGNATFEWWGRASFEGGVLKFEKSEITGEEELWQAFRQKIAEE